MHDWLGLIGRWPTLVAALVLVTLGTWLIDDTDRQELVGGMLLAAGLLLLGVHLGVSFARRSPLPPPGADEEPRNGP